MSRRKRVKVPTDLIPYMGVLGVPMGKKEFAIRTAQLPSFLESHSEKIRSVLTAISLLDSSDIERLTAVAYSPLSSVESRARAAWEILAWHAMFAPYAHAAREFYINDASLVNILKRDPSYYYLYALIILKEPRQDVYDALRAMHIDIANVYSDYARNISIAQGNDPEILTKLYNW